eukprot:669511-Amphidinium_carterae.2
MLSRFVRMTLPTTITSQVQKDITNSKTYESLENLESMVAELIGWGVSSVAIWVATNNCMLNLPSPILSRWFFTCIATSANVTFGGVTRYSCQVGLGRAVLRV